MDQTIQKTLSYTTLTVQIRTIGEDYQILLQGGDRPHIGCTVLAIPRPSLDAGKQQLITKNETCYGDENGVHAQNEYYKMSSTASVINVTGHKDEQICRYLAEKIAAKKQAVTVCTGGFHVDHITEAQIAEVLEAVQEIEKAI